MRIYTSQHCGPCQKVRELVKQGRFQGEIELVDIDTDEGFDLFIREVLSKGDGAVPSAYQDGKECKLGYAEDGDLTFECPEPDAPPASPEGK